MATASCPMLFMYWFPRAIRMPSYFLRPPRRDLYCYCYVPIVPSSATTECCNIPLRYCLSQMPSPFLGNYSGTGIVSLSAMYELYVTHVCWPVRLGVAFPAVFNVHTRLHHLPRIISSLAPGRKCLIVTAATAGRRFPVEKGAIERGTSRAPGNGQMCLEHDGTTNTQDAVRDERQTKLTVRFPDGWARSHRQTGCRVVTNEAEKETEPGFALSPSSIQW